MPITEPELAVPGSIEPGTGDIGDGSYAAAVVAPDPLGGGEPGVIEPGTGDVGDGIYSVSASDTFPGYTQIFEMRAQRAQVFDMGSN